MHRAHRSYSTGEAKQNETKQKNKPWNKQKGDPAILAGFRGDSHKSSFGPFHLWGAPWHPVEFHMTLNLPLVLHGSFSTYVFRSWIDVTRLCIKARVEITLMGDQKQIFELVELLR